MNSIKNAHYDIDQEKDIYQRTLHKKWSFPLRISSFLCSGSNTCSDDKVNKNGIMDKTDLIWVILTTLMVPQTSAKVVKMTSELRRITQ